MLAIAGCADSEYHEDSDGLRVEVGSPYDYYLSDTIQVENVPISPEEVERKAEPLIEAFWATDEFLEKFEAYNEFVEVDNENQRWADSITRDKFGLDNLSSRRIAFTVNQEVKFSFLEVGFRDRDIRRPFFNSS